MNTPDLTCWTPAPQALADEVITYARHAGLEYPGVWALAHGLALAVEALGDPARATDPARAQATLSVIAGLLR
jgi:hypothetical protein